METVRTVHVGRFSLRMASGILCAAAMLIGLSGPVLAETLFEPSAVYGSGGSSPYELAAGDFNHDGHLDLAITNRLASTVGILLGNGDGSFQTAVAYASGGFLTSSVTIGDFNGDGNADLAVSSIAPGNFSVLLGNGDGTFQPPVTVPLNGEPEAVITGDFNHDGNADLAVANLAGYVSVVLGNGDGTFGPEVQYPGTANAIAFAIGDFNGDGNADLAVSGSGDSSVVYVLMGNGDGTFQPEVDYPALGSNTTAIAAADFNGDGRLDLAVTSNSSNLVSILIGNGDGSFQAPASYPTLLVPTGVVVGDFNADGQLDLAVADADGTFGGPPSYVSILLGNGDGTFQAPNNYPTGSDSQWLAVGDFNGDGTPDLAVSNSNSNDVSILLNAPGVPVITSGASLTTPIRIPFDMGISTTGTPTPAITESGLLPTGVSLTDNGNGTADLAGVPAAGTAGTWPFTIIASNGVGAPATQSFVLTVTSDTSPPYISSPASDTETFGVPFSFTVNTLGYPVPKLTKSGALPAGVSWVANGDGTATIAGTPTRSAVGAYGITLTAKSSAGTVTQGFTLTITKAPVIKKIPTTTGAVGSALSLSISSSGYTTPTLTESGGLPSGVAFTDNGDGTGTISGVPAVGTGASYAITITATNGLGASSQAFTLKIDEASVITSASNATATVGSPFSFSVTATGFPVPKITKTGTLPKGVTYSGANATFSGTPKAGSAGSYVITITATNSSGTVTQELTLTVH